MAMWLVTYKALIRLNNEAKAKMMSSLVREDKEAVAIQKVMDFNRQGFKNTSEYSAYNLTEILESKGLLIAVKPVPGEKPAVEQTGPEPVETPKEQLSEAERHLQEVEEKADAEMNQEEEPEKKQVFLTPQEQEEQQKKAREGRKPISSMDEVLS